MQLQIAAASWRMEARSDFAFSKITYDLLRLQATNEQTNERMIERMNE